MSIEGGGIGGAIGGAGGLAGAASGAVSLEASFGPVIGLPDMAPVVMGNVFKGSMADLQPFEPLGQMNVDVLSQAGEVAGRAWDLPLELEAMPIGQPKIDVLSQVETIANKAWDANVITEAEDVLIQAQKPAIFSPVSRVEPLVVPFALPNIAPNILAFPKPEVVASPALSPAVRLGPQTEAKAAVEIKPAVATQPLPEEQEVEEAVTERVTTKQIDTVEEDETTERKFYLEDEEASAQRKYEIREAIIKARTEADRLGLKKITGWLVAKFLPAEYRGIRSQVVKKTGPDGSYQETVEAIFSVGELESEEKAMTKLSEIVSLKKPVKYGENGSPVGNEDVARVFKYRLVKPVTPYEEVITRVLKKKVVAPQLSIVPPVSKVEAGLEKVNPVLAEAFPKAA